MRQRARPRRPTPIKPARKKPAKKKVFYETSRKKETLDPGTPYNPLGCRAGCGYASNVNVRGQAKLNSEVITKVTKGQTVSVLEEVNLKKSGPDEPFRLGKDYFAAGTHVWVNGKFVDPATMTVTSSKLKIRGGPGENYSVFGIFKKGDELKQQIPKVNGWKFKLLRRPTDSLLHNT